MTASSCLPLVELGFVRVPGGDVRLGTNKPLPCRLEGHRRNETPVRFADTRPFWIARCCVTNAEFERFRPQYQRPLTSPRDRQPVTDVTYLEAIRYARWLSRRHGFELTLPTEAQWTAAAAPFGLEFPWGDAPDTSRARSRGDGVIGPTDVDDPNFAANHLGLHHVTGNVQQMMLGTHYALGSDGAETDGMYCIVKGGDWRHCAFSVGVARRGLMDVAGRAPTVGFRLAVNLP
ncbi:MAG: SUMF1/EgtB/PvdO family nonheme iron enzyme [Patescibacteria group bacterium]|nr:SUMF1/EgtB/PvdO family nonheme iron enzyme [Patescibacteria group bacterium]